MGYLFETSGEKKHLQMLWVSSNALGATNNTYHLSGAAKVW